MIHIVTGSVNSGKTSKLAAMYQFENKGDGFVAVKEMESGVVTAYNAMRLRTMEERLFLAREGFVPEGFDSCCRIGPYRMSKQGLEWVEREVRGLIDQKVSPIYLDEIGDLELEGKGFDSIFRLCLDSGLELYVAVRKDFVEPVLKKYGIQEYDLM
jgi:nucleoside-triphosphatase THEP1